MWTISLWSSCKNYPNIYDLHWSGHNICSFWKWRVFLLQQKCAHFVIFSTQLRVCCEFCILASQLLLLPLMNNFRNWICNILVCQYAFQSGHAGWLQWHQTCYTWKSLCTSHRWRFSDPFSSNTLPPGPFSSSIIDHLSWVLRQASVCHTYQIKTWHLPLVRCEIWLIVKYCVDQKS